MVRKCTYTFYYRGKLCKHKFYVEDMMVFEMKFLRIIFN
jgi:hypothetical protein